MALGRCSTNPGRREQNDEQLGAKAGHNVFYPKRRFSAAYIKLVRPSKNSRAVGVSIGRVFEGALDRQQNDRRRPPRRSREILPPAIQICARSTRPENFDVRRGCFGEQLIWAKEPLKNEPALGRPHGVGGRACCSRGMIRLIRALVEAARGRRHLMQTDQRRYSPQTMKRPISPGMPPGKSRTRALRWKPRGFSSRSQRR